MTPSVLDFGLIRTRLNDRQALIATLVGEAAGEAVESQIAVGCAIRNRVLADLGHDAKPDWWGEHFAGVCLAPWQFSCWWEKDAPNTARVYALADTLLHGQPTNSPRLIAQLGWIADGLIADAVIDITQGSTHYVTTALLNAAPPAWAKGKTPCIVIGHHSFFKDIG